MGVFLKTILTFVIAPEALYEWIVMDWSNAIFHGPLIYNQVLAFKNINTFLYT